MLAVSNLQLPARHKIVPTQEGLPARMDFKSVSKLRHKQSKSFTHILYPKPNFKLGLPDCTLSCFQYICQFHNAEFECKEAETNCWRKLEEGRKDMCRRLRRWEKLLRKPLEDAGGGKPANTLLKLDVTLGKPYKKPPPPRDLFSREISLVASYAHMGGGVAKK